MWLTIQCDERWWVVHRCINVIGRIGWIGWIGGIGGIGGIGWLEESNEEHVSPEDKYSGWSQWGVDGLEEEVDEKVMFLPGVGRRLGSSDSLSESIKR